MGMGGQRHVLTALRPGKTRYRLCRKLGGLQGRSGQGGKSRPSWGSNARTSSPYRVTVHSPSIFIPYLKYKTNTALIKICTAYFVSFEGGYGGEPYLLSFTEYYKFIAHILLSGKQTRCYIAIKKLKKKQTNPCHTLSWKVCSMSMNLFPKVTFIDLSLTNSLLFQGYTRTLGAHSNLSILL